MVMLHALGAVRITDGGGDVAMGGPRQRRLLAVLLRHRDEVVSTDRIADVVFAGAPTDAAGTTLRSYVARLRRVLAATGPEVTVQTRAPGYCLRAPRQVVDVCLFEDAVDEARAALRDGEPARASRLARTGLDRWQGPAYAEFADEEWIYAEAQRLAELRLAAQEALVEAELALGHTENVLPLLERMCTEHPLREGYRAQLITAYYGSGRQADALSAYQAFRAELADELGLDPSPRLVELEHRILVQDPALLVPRPRGEPLHGYQVGERLGTGRDGVVRAARLPGASGEYALKVLRAAIADDPSFIRSFDSTAHRVASLRHPGVLPLHDYWREPGVAYLVAPRVDGGTLADRIRSGDLSPTNLRDLLEHVGGALVAAHDSRVVHGNLTPGNVLYDGPDRPVLADFWVGQPDRRTDASDDRTALVALVQQCAARTGIDGDVTVALEALSSAPPADTTSLVHELHELLEDAPRSSGRVRLNPYRGLRAFGESDAAYFFGREELVDELLARLHSPDGRLVLLVGASGTGKSSVIQAGVLPRLRMAEPAVPRYVTSMLPGATPYRALARALLAVSTAEVTRRRGWDVEGLAAELGADEAGLDRVLAALLPAGAQLVLLVDQFEELFTMAPVREQARFTAMLAHAVSNQTGRLRVLATLRADFYDRPLAVQPFGSLVSAATVAIPAMLPAEIESAVVEPAVRVGRRVERGLAAELVARIAAEPTALPALQFVLYELAERSTDAALTLADYRELGGLDGAISARAEELYQSLDDDERAAVRRMFEELAVVDAEGEPTRRRTLRRELSVADEVVDRWAGVRLLSLDIHPQSRLPTVEVAHEALLREWPRLRHWIEEDRSELVVLQRLREAAGRWAADRDESELYRGAALQAAVEVARNRNSLTPEETEFLAAGLAARRQEEQAAAELIARQARTNRRLRFQLVGIAVALVGALVGGMLALDQRSAAIRARHVAEARELSAAADANVRDDPERSILLALAAVDATQRHDEPVLPQAEEALHRAVTSSRVLLRVPGAGGTLDWTSDGRWFTTEGIEETGMVTLYDARTGRKVRTWKGDKVDLNDVAFSGNGKLLATSGDDGSVKVWSVPGGHKVAEQALAGGREVWGPALNRDGSLVAACWWNNVDRVVVTDTRTGRIVFQRHVPVPEDTAFSPDGSQLAVVRKRTDVLVFDLRSGRQLHVLDGFPRIQDIAWSPDGRWIAAAASDGAAWIFDARSGRFRFRTAGNNAEVSSVAWSRDSRFLATAGQDGTARVHELTPNGPRQLLRLASQDLRNGTRSVRFSPDGSRLMTSDWAISAVQVWDIRPDGGAEIMNLLGGTAGRDAAAVSADGKTLFSSDGGRGLRRTDLPTMTSRGMQPVPADAGNSVFDLAASPDGRLLAGSTDRAQLLLWDARTGRLRDRLGRSWKAEWIEDLAWRGDGRYLAVSTFLEEHGVLRVLQPDGTEVARVEERRGRWLPSIDFHGGDVIAAALRNTRDDPSLQQPRLLNWRTGEVVRQYDGRSVQVADDPTGHLLAAARLIEGLVDVWDRRTGEHLAILSGHTGPVTDLTFTPDGRKLVTASVDGTARVWNPRTGALEIVLPTPDTDPVSGVELAAGGSRLLTLGYDGVIRAWTLDLDELVRIARSKLTRGLTTAECQRFLDESRCPRVVRGPVP